MRAPIQAVGENQQEWSGKQMHEWEDEAFVSLPEFWSSLGYKIVEG